MVWRKIDANTEIVEEELQVVIEKIGDQLIQIVDIKYREKQEINKGRGIK